MRQDKKKHFIGNYFVVCRKVRRMWNISLRFGIVHISYSADYCRYKTQKNFAYNWSTFYFWKENFWPVAASLQGCPSPNTYPSTIKHLFKDDSARPLPPVINDILFLSLFYFSSGFFSLLLTVSCGCKKNLEPQVLLSVIDTLCNCRNEIYLNGNNAPNMISNKLEHK